MRDLLVRTMLGDTDAAFDLGRRISERRDQVWEEVPCYPCAGPYCVACDGFGVRSRCRTCGEFARDGECPCQP